MAQVGKWGSVTFSVSENKAYTFNNLSWTTTPRFETKERKKKVSSVTFKGIDPDTISFEMRFSVFLGINPLKEIEKLDKLARAGKKNRLIIGGKKIGKNNWVITGLTKDMKYFDRDGKVWYATVKVSMKEKP